MKLDPNRPELFLDGIDPERETARFRLVEQGEVQSITFLDQRAPFGRGDPIVVPIDHMVEMADRITPAPVRLILHMSFCGSTQMSHLIDASGAALVLKEPQALVDLADWDRTLRGRGRASAKVERAVDAALTLFSRPWLGGLPSVIKPSNWANTPLLQRPSAGPNDRILLMTIDARSFLRAAFRGGRDRLAFLTRFVVHLAEARGQSHWVAAAIDEEIDPLVQAARLVLTAHELQLRAFDSFMVNAHPGSARAIDYAELLASPTQALTRAIDHFKLPADGPSLATAVDRRSVLDAKRDSTAFNPQRQDDADRAIERLHGDRFDRACEWAAAIFSSSDAVPTAFAQLSRA